METTNTESVLDSFALLREGTEQSQKKASIIVLDHLRKKQLESSSEVICQELYLGVRRIIRGLGSPRSKARKGFYAAFIGLIHTFPQISFQDFCDAIEKEFSDYHPGEESDVFKGIILAYGALISSGTILRAESQQICQIVSKLISISQKKSYLLLAVTTYLVGLIEKIDEGNFKDVWNLLHANFINNKKKLVLEAYCLLMTAQNRFPTIINSQYLKQALGSSEIFSESSFDTIANQCLCIPHISYIESPMYQYIFNQFLSSKTFVKKIWDKIDQYLSTPTALRMMVAFKLLTVMANKFENKSYLLYAFTPNFILLLESKQEENEDIERARRDAIDALCQNISSSGDIKSKKLISVIDKLFFYPGSFRFLYGPGIRLFQSLITNLKEDTVKILAKMFHEVLIDKSKKVVEKISDDEVVIRPWKDSQKKSSIMVLSKLLNHPSVASCVEWKVNHLKVLIDIGFFKKGISAKLTNAARNTFYLTLDQKFQRVTDLRSFLSASAVYFDEKLCNCDYISVEFTNDTRKLWTSMMKIVSSLDKNATDAGKLASTTFHVMFLQFGLTLFKDPKGASENLKELKSIYKHLNLETEDGNQLLWTDVITDLILSLLSQSDRFNRHIVTKVFIYLCPYFTAENIHQMLDVLNPNRKNPLTVVNNEVEDSEEGEDNESSQDEESNEEEDGNDSSEDDDSDESDIDMSDEELDEAHCEKLRAEVRSALGNDAALTDTESVDLDDMNEEEGKNLDEKLSEAFRSIKQQQQKRHAVQEKDLCVFRLKVLDLIEVWTRTEPELNVLLDVIVTVLMLLENTTKESGDTELLAKLKQFIKKVTSVKKYKFTKDFDHAQLIQLVEKITSREDRTQSVYISMTNEIIHCCTFIFKVSMRENCNMEKTHEKLLAVYRSLLKECFLNNNSIVPIGLFQSVLDLTCNDSLILVEDIASIVFNEKLRPFQRCQALRLLEVYFRNKRLLTKDFIVQNKDKLQEITIEIIDKGQLELQENYSDKLYFQFVQTKSAIKKSGITENDWVAVEKNLQQMRLTSLKKDNASKSGVGQAKKKMKTKEAAVESKGGSDNEDDDIMKPVETNDINNSKKKVKRKKKNNRILSKKERKIRRANESSKGFGDVFSFSSVANKIIK